MSEHITVKRASELTGLSEQTIRVGIERGKLEFGRAIPSKSGNRHTYHINPKKLEDYLGMQEILNKEIDHSSVTDFKIKFLESEFQRLNDEIHEQNIIIKSILDAQEYIIRRMNGDKIKGCQSLYDCVIKNFCNKPIF